MKELLEVFKKDEKNYYERLKSIYEKVESGDCAGCGLCCSESVGATYTESLNIISFIKKNNIMTRKLMDSIVDYYLDVYIKRNKCPFLDEDKKCLIYDVRPLNCRLYGHWVEKEYEANYERLLKENIEISKELEKSYDFKVPNDYLAFKIPYCKDFKGKIMKKPQRDALYDLTLKEDNTLILKNDINIEYEDMGIVEHILSYLLNKDIILNLKLKDKLNKKMRNRIKNIAWLRWSALRL